MFVRIGRDRGRDRERRPDLSRPATCTASYMAAHQPVTTAAMEGALPYRSRRAAW